MNFSPLLVEWTKFLWFLIILLIISDELHSCMLYVKFINHAWWDLRNIYNEWNERQTVFFKTSQIPNTYHWSIILLVHSIMKDSECQMSDLTNNTQIMNSVTRSPIITCIFHMNMAFQLCFFLILWYEKKWNEGDLFKHEF